VYYTISSDLYNNTYDRALIGIVAHEDDTVVSVVLKNDVIVYLEDGTIVSGPVLKQRSLCSVSCSSSRDNRFEILPVSLQSATLTPFYFQTTLNMTLNAHDAWELQSLQDLSGSRVYTKKFISVFSGNVRTKIPSTQASRDHLVEQIPLTDFLGTNYSSISTDRKHRLALNALFA